MKFDFTTTSTLITLGLLIGSNLIWLLKSYGSSEKKKYAAEREFQHLKRNQEQLLTNLTNIFQDLESRLTLISRDIQEIKFTVSKKN